MGRMTIVALRKRIGYSGSEEEDRDSGSEEEDSYSGSEEEDSDSGSEEEDRL